MKKTFLAFVLGALLIVGTAAYQYSGVLTNGFGFVKIGNAATGSQIDLIEVHEIAFVNATSGTATSAARDGAPVFASFATSSADPGKIIASVASGTLTVTCGTATTGTVNVNVIQRTTD